MGDGSGREWDIAGPANRKGATSALYGQGWGVRERVIGARRASGGLREKKGGEGCADRDS